MQRESSEESSERESSEESSDDDDNDPDYMAGSSTGQGSSSGQGGSARGCRRAKPVEAVDGKQSVSTAHGKEPVSTALPKKDRLQVNKDARKSKKLKLSEQVGRFMQGTKDGTLNKQKLKERLAEFKKEMDIRIATYFNWDERKQKWCPKPEFMLTRESMKTDPEAKNFKAAYEATGCGFIELTDMNQDAFIEYFIRYVWLGLPFENVVLTDLMATNPDKSVEKQINAHYNDLSEKWQDKYVALGRVLDPDIPEDMKLMLKIFKSPMRGILWKYFTSHQAFGMLHKGFGAPQEGTSVFGPGMLFPGFETANLHVLACDSKEVQKGMEAVFGNKGWYAQRQQRSIFGLPKHGLKALFHLDAGWEFVAFVSDCIRQVMKEKPGLSRTQVMTEVRRMMGGANRQEVQGKINVHGPCKFKGLIGAHNWLDLIYDLLLYNLGKEPQRNKKKISIDADEEIGKMLEAMMVLIDIPEGYLFVWDKGTPHGHGLWNDESEIPNIGKYFACFCDQGKPLPSEEIASRLSDVMARKVPDRHPSNDLVRMGPANFDCYPDLGRDVYGRFRMEFRGRDLPLSPIFDVNKKTGVETMRLDGKGRPSLKVNDWSPYTCPEDMTYGRYGGIPQTTTGLVKAGLLADATNTELPRVISSFLVEQSKGARFSNVYRMQNEDDEVASGAASGAARGPARGSCGGVARAGGNDTAGTQQRSSCVPASLVKAWKAQCEHVTEVSDSDD